MSTVWIVMFFTESSLLSRLDSIVFLMGLLTMLPLILNQSARPIIIYTGANILILYLFIFLVSNQLATAKETFIDYLADNTVGFILVGIVSFQVFSINRKSLNKVEIDIQVRKQAEIALKDSEEKYRTVIENANEAIFVLQGNGIKFTNPKTCELSGYTSQELYEKMFLDIVHPDDQEMIIEKYIGRQSGKNIDELYTFRVIGKQGNIIWSEIKPVIINWEGEVATLCFINVITERKHAEEAQRVSEEKFRLISEQSLLAIAIFQDNVFKYVNDTASQMSGYTVNDIMGWKRDEFLKLIHPDDVALVLNQFEMRQPDEHKSIIKSTYRIITKSGENKSIEVHSKSITYQEKAAELVTVQDITERKKVEELMIQTEKMISVGGLAAGMAHELNNPLGGMLQGIQTVQLRLSPDLRANQEPAKKFGIDLHNLQLYLEKRDILSYCNGIRESGKKASQIISNMLQFSRKSESQMSLTNLAELVENVLELAGKDYDLKKRFDFRNFKIVKDFEPNMPLVKCTTIELEQVLLNLLNNAAWAMIRAKIDHPQITLQIKIDQNMARMEVEDNGPGMNERTRKRVFEPFFTTKPVGEGTGLGLSVSYMIITNNHKGTMEVESKLGQGTKFTIRLPF